MSREVCICMVDANWFEIQYYTDCRECVVKLGKSSISHATAKVEHSFLHLITFLNGFYGTWTPIMDVFTWKLR